MPDIEAIVKLLRSDNPDDNQLGFEYLNKECHGNSNKMNKLLYETNLRISYYDGPRLFILTVKGGRTIKRLKKVSN